MPAPPPSAPVFDAHTHAFPDFLARDAVRNLVGGAQWWDVRAYEDGTVLGLLQAMQRAGIERALLYSIATRPAQVANITNWSAQVAAQHPALVPFASIHPDFPQPEQEIERIVSLGLRGLKCHPQYMNCAADDPRLVRIARCAASYGLAMTMHAGYDPAFPRSDIGSPLRIRRLHDAVPGLRLLACHLGGWQQWEQVLECLVGQDVYLDTSYSLGPCPQPVLEAMLARHAPQRLLYGSDSPWADCAQELTKFRALGLSDDSQRLALWDNVLEFAGLPQG